MKKTQKEIIRDVEETIIQTSAYLKQYPSDANLTWLFQELHRLEGIVKRQWPLTKQEQDGIFLAVFAARNLDELDDAKLAIRVTHLDAALKSQ
jgi:hypothetical protein